jgi:hypothetical protein
LGYVTTAEGLCPIALSTPTSDRIPHTNKRDSEALLLTADRISSLSFTSDAVDTKF